MHKERTTNKLNLDMMNTDYRYQLETRRLTGRPLQKELSL